MPKTTKKGTPRQEELPSTLQRSDEKAQRTAAETRLVTLVDGELRARANEMLVNLRRDVEAAEFGSASALFFKTRDAERRTNAAGTTDTTGAVRRVPLAPTNPINPPK